MAQSKCNNSESRGFTLAEVCVSIAVLTIGLVAAAGMFGKVWGSTAYSEYMIQASTLASEKLEDLNRYPNGDPNVAVPNGTSAGSLSSDLDASVTSNGVTETVDYFDEVFVSAASGSVSETVATGTSPNYVYTTTTHSPNGSIGPVTGSTFPATLYSVRTPLDSRKQSRRWRRDHDQHVAHHRPRNRDQQLDSTARYLSDEFGAPMKKSIRIRAARLRRIAGFTLIEFMAAMGIFMVVGGAAFMLFRQDVPLFNQQQNLAGLNIGIQNAVTQIQQDVVNAGAGYYASIGLLSWPVGITIVNTTSSSGSPCQGTNYTYNSTCFDTLNIITSDPTVTAQHARAQRGCAHNVREHQQ